MYKYEWRVYAMENFRLLQPLLGYARRAVDDYGMIKENDMIAVGVSGGKDSMTLLAALRGLQRFYPLKFGIVPIRLDMGFPGADLSPIERFCERLELELVTVKTDIYEIVFNIRKESSPCSLCANLRRGALHDAAIANGCRTMAFGHHFDDAVETFMLNLFNEGRLGCFAPVTFLDRKQVTLIRPLIYMPESFAVRFITQNSIDILPKYCSEDGFTDREKVKNLLAELEHEKRGLKKRIFGAIERGELNGFCEHPKQLRRKTRTDESANG